MTTLPDGIALRSAQGIDEIPAATLYRIARLRQDVFIVEQECPYPDLDGRDLEPGTVQLWTEARPGDGTPAEVAATVRILLEDAQEPGLRSIGRVVTSPAWRGRGIAAALMEAAIEACAGHPVVVYAQSHLAHWYGRFGFEVHGEEFLEDGIPHLPMRIG